MSAFVHDHGTQLTITSAQRRGVECWVIEVWVDGKLTHTRALHYEFLANDISDTWRRQYREFNKGEPLFVRKVKVSPVTQIQDTF